MKKILCSLVFVLMTTIGFGQCDAVNSINEDFDNWEAIDPCWKTISNGGMIYPDSDVTFYAMAGAGISMYLISPEVVEGSYHLKMDGYTHSLNGSQTEGVRIQIGTVSNVNDASTFVAVSEEVNLLNDAQVIETGINFSGEAKYFAVKISVVTPHSAAGIDNLILEAVTAGTNDSEMSKMKLYPNPVSDQLNITSNDKIQEVKIFNVSGQLVASLKANATSATMNVSNLKAGVFMVQIQTEKGIQTSKLIKK
jgi:hypothetical protein